jgi:transketolase
VDYSEITKNIRESIIVQLENSKSGHPGGSLSAVEILTFLYYEKMNVNPEDPEDENRDRFVLSKGHAAPVLYATLAEKGYFDKAELVTLRKIGSMLQGHPDMKKVPGVDMSTGSLGQGISAAVGMALSAKIDNKDYKTYALLGDGELDEGLVWEAAMAAAHYKLDNLMVFVDYNGLQIDGDIRKVMNPIPIDRKFKAFGWETIMVKNGNDIDEIRAVCDSFKAEGKPKAVICKTTKGKGVSFMENQAGWHGKAPDTEQAKAALAEIGGAE